MIQAVNSIQYPAFYKWFPTADIHELLAPDLLHQVYKERLRTHSQMDSRLSLYNKWSRMADKILDDMIGGESC